MPEVLGDPPSPRAALFWNGTAWQWALVDAAGHLQIDVLTIAAGVDVATETTLALALARLQRIDDIIDALQSVATDRLIVRGEDQLFSIKGLVRKRVVAAISGASGYVQSPAVPAGQIWAVNTIQAWDTTSPVTQIELTNWDTITNYEVGAERKAFVAGEPSSWTGVTRLDVNSRIRAYFSGGLVGDTCTVAITGYYMTVEV